MILLIKVCVVANNTVSNEFYIIPPCHTVTVIDISACTCVHAINYY